MPPTAADLTAGRALAERIVAAGLGRVRRVVMIGSRALGTARADSDLDIVVVVEIPASDPPWGTADVLHERKRLQEAVGQPPVKTDLWVCTTDQLEEGRLVVGGVESLVETEGFDLYSRALDREPLVRRSRDQVRCANARGWLEQAMLACEHAEAHRRDAPDPGSMRTPGTLVRTSVRAAINALLVAHQIRSSKHESGAAVLEKLARADPALADWLRAVFASNWQSSPVARTVLRAVVERIERDPGMPRLLASLHPRLVGSAPAASQLARR